MKLRVRLAGFTLVEWWGIVEVPDGTSSEEIQDVVDAVYEDVDGGEYDESSDYWEKGTCWTEAAPDHAVPFCRAKKDENGAWTLEPNNAP